MSFCGCSWHLSHQDRKKKKSRCTKNLFCSDTVCLGKQFIGQKLSPSSHGQQFLETDSYMLLLTRDSQRNFSTLTLFTICLAVTWAMHSSHQPKSLFVLTAFMRTRCSWVSLDLNHTDTAGNNLIRHKQVSSSLKHPFILWPTGMFRHLKIFNRLVNSLL